MRRGNILNWFHLRTVVVMLGLALIAAPDSYQFASWLDKYIFQSGVALMQPRSGEMKIAVVELPQSEMSYLINDPGRAEVSAKLLRTAITDGATVGIVLDDSPKQQTNWAQSVLEELQANDTLAAEVKKISQNYRSVEDSIKKHFQSDGVILGIHADANPPAIVVESSAASDLLSWLPSWKIPQPPVAEFTSNGDEQLSLYPVDIDDASKSIAWPLLWQSNEQVGLNFVGQVYARFSKAKEATWHRNSEIAFDNGIVLSTSADGSVLPFYNRWPHNIIQIESLTLEQAVANSPKQALILLGTDAAQLQGLARVLLSLDHQAYFKHPAWATLAGTALILVLLLYVAMLLPRLATVSALLATCLIVVLMVVVQVGWQITQWIWIPTGLAIQYLLLGHALISLWKYQRDRLVKAQAAAHGARYQLGLQLFRDGRPDDALLAIKECYASDAVAQLMYDIAAQQERKRQYGAAIKTYQVLNSQKKQFRDVREKIEKLIAFSSGTAAGLSADGEIAKTLIISESTINKPVLGRYEIERELGRGAMGVVYLGRDPKISRQVAIKTLSYSNLDPQHLDEFKQRFFREAEAAGRLSHPNIVTIYDVGEEHDLAFIAMDYIEGKALSSHIHKDTLLPVTITYHILAEVADGLGYAHDKHVIHRDVKPGNIMYQAENDNIKITDFGVARLVDNARTNTGDILGSPLYMSPEQLKGDKVTAQTDIYSLGVTMYQLLTAQVPFTGDSIASLTYNIIHQKHKPVRDLRPDLPPSATRIINRALSKDPAKRFRKIADFAEALRNSLEDDFG